MDRNTHRRSGPLPLPLPHGTMTEIQIHTLADLREADFDALAFEEHHRFDVLVEGIVVPLLVVKRSGASTTVVMCNGAVDQARAGRAPVFQRSSWSGDFQHHQVYVHDPATGAPEYLSLAWGQLTEHKWAVDAISKVVQTMSAKLGVKDPKDRLYFGSSAGGFMALGLLGNDPGARALVNNAQFDWTRWMATGVNALRHARFRGMLPADIRSRHPLTSNVLRLLAHKGDPLKIDYYVNLASSHDRKQDLPTFNQFVAEYPHLCENVQVHHYFHAAAGHNPMQRRDTVKLINKAFSDDAGPVTRILDNAVVRKDKNRTGSYPVCKWNMADNVDLTSGPFEAQHEILDVSGERLPLSSLLLQRPGSDTLVVILHAMIDRRRQTLPRFENVRSLRQLPYHMLFLSDPTLNLSPSLRLGWFIGTEKDNVTQRLATLIQDLGQRLGVRKIVLVGSASGGFAAMAMTPLISSSLALVFSPLADIYQHSNGAAARALCRAGFPDCKNLTELQTQHGQRTDLRRLYETTSSGRVWYVQNSGDPERVSSHMRRMTDLDDVRIEFVLEHFCSGHNPPTTRRIREWIHTAATNFNETPQQFALPATKGARS